MPGVNIKQKVLLSLEQQKVLQFVVGDGKNVFFTGSAGMSTFTFPFLHPQTWLKMV